MAFKTKCPLMVAGWLAGHDDIALRVDDKGDKFQCLESDCEWWMQGYTIGDTPVRMCSFRFMAGANSEGKLVV